MILTPRVGIPIFFNVKKFKSHNFNIAAAIQNNHSALKLGNENC